MKKQIIIVSIISMFIAALYFGQKAIVSPNPTASSSATYRIAFFVPAVHPSMDDIEQGVKDNLQKANDYSMTVDTYNANGNRTLLRAQAEEIIQRSYDLIITVGAQCSQTIHQLIVKKELTVPQVFCAIDDPIKLGLVSTFNTPDNKVTGVLSTSDYAQQLQTLISLKPSTKTILLVYDPTQGSGFEKDRIMLEQEAKKQGLMFETLQVANAQDIAQKVPAQLTSVDVIFVLTDHTVVAAIDLLVNLCNRYHVLLYTSELNSADKGAGLSFGVTEYDYGKTAAQLGLRILIDHQLPAQIPIVTMQSQRIKINTKTAPLQGLELSLKQLDTLRSNGAIIV